MERPPGRRGRRGLAYSHRGTFPDRADDARTSKLATFANETVAPVLAPRLCTRAFSIALTQFDVELVVKMLMADVHPDWTKNSRARAGSCDHLTVAESFA
jgi:hypothetical protein